MGTPTTPDLVDLWADALLPEAFAFPHSAFRVDLRDEPTDLAAWTRREIETALDFRYPGSGSLVGGIVAVQDRGVRWQWHHEPDHPFRWTAHVVSRELGAFEQPWLLAADIPGPLEAWVERDDGDELEVVDPDWTLRWYAEVRRPGLADVASGALAFHLDELVGIRTTDPTTDPFARHTSDMLRGHPSRRRHRLRS